MGSYVSASYLEAKGDLSVLSETDKNDYKSNSVATPNAIGGDQTLLNIYQDDLRDATKRAAWFGSVAQKPDADLTDITLTEITSIYTDLDHPALKKAGKNIGAALMIRLAFVAKLSSLMSWKMSPTERTLKFISPTTSPIPINSLQTASL